MFERQTSKDDVQPSNAVKGNQRFMDKPDKHEFNVSSAASVPALLSQPTLQAMFNGPSNSDETVKRQTAVERSSSPPVSISSVHSSAALCSASSQLSTQYSQFLESVRGFQPLLADLNASIASVTNSVSTMGTDVTVAPVSNGGMNGMGDGPCPGNASSGGSSEIWLHSPVVLRSSMEAGLTPDSAEDSPNMRDGHQQGFILRFYFFVVDSLSFDRFSVEFAYF